MRWQQLFADLGAQFEEAEAAAQQAEGSSRARAEMGAVRLVERLRGAVGAAVVVRCQGAGQVAGVLGDVGADWLLIDEDGGREVLVAGAAVSAVAGLGRQTAPEPAGVVGRRLDLRRAVRALARDRSAVQVVLRDGGVLTGTVDRVGADFLEVAAHPLGDERRAGAVRGVQAIALDAVAAIRTGTSGLG
jgi:hypothetical protein